MTREEAIWILNETQVVYFAPNGKKKVQEALDMAIEALSSAEYEEADGVITIEKQSAKDVGEIKHIIIRSPNYTRYFYNESMPLPSADAEQVTSKLKNPCNSLLTDDSAECKEQKSKLESADAVHGWRIGKPTEQGEYMVTIDSFGHKHIDLFYYGKPLMPNRKVRGNCWYRSDDEWGDVVHDDTDILAWQPLPKPYKGGENE